jgi:hypothetical protein
MLTPMRSSDASDAIPRPGRLGALGKARLVGEVLLNYPSAWRLVRANDLERMVRESREVSPAPHSAGAAAEHELALRLGVAVTRTLGLLPTDSRCLVRSLVLSRLLSRRAIPSRLVIGVTPGPDFVGHAWVEHDGRPVSPPGRHERLIEL